MRDLPREIQLEDLGEAPLKDLEGGNGRGFYSKALWKEMGDIGKKKNGQALQVMEEGGEMFLSPSLQSTDHIQEPLPLLHHQKVDFLWTGAALDQDLPL